MRSILVIGLESSCTKIVGQMLAINFGLIDSVSNWDGHEFVEDDQVSIVHRSLPHGRQGNFLSEEFFLRFTDVIVVTRDWSSSLKSKLHTHNRDNYSAMIEHVTGVGILKGIVANANINSFVFSYESALLLQEAYTIDFMKQLKIENPQHIKFTDVNNKYQIKEI